MTWLPEDREKAKGQWFKAFEALTGKSVREVVEQSDYKELSAKAGGGRSSVLEILNDLVLPRASDTSNCGIQLRTVAEWGAALRILDSEPPCRYVMMDTTMSLPFVKNKSGSLFLNISNVFVVSGEGNSEWSVHPQQIPSPSFHGVDRKFGKGGIGGT